MKKDFYKILGLPKNASSKDIKKSYFKLVKIHHPDLSKKENLEKFQSIKEAYNTLFDPKKRELYDQRLNDKKVNKNVTKEDHLKKSNKESVSSYYKDNFNKLVKKTVNYCLIGGVTGLVFVLFVSIFKKVDLIDKVFIIVFTCIIFTFIALDQLFKIPKNRFYLLSRSASILIGNIYLLSFVFKRVSIELVIVFALLISLFSSNPEFIIQVKNEEISKILKNILTNLIYGSLGVLVSISISGLLNTNLIDSIILGFILTLVFKGLIK